MKNLLKVGLFAIFAIFSLVIVSCSSDDDGGKKKEVYNHSVNPPAWLYGTWLNDDNQEILKISSSDFKLMTDTESGSALIDLQKYIEAMEKGNSVKINIAEEKAENSYVIKAISSDKSVTTYSFTKLENDKLEMCLNKELCQNLTKK
ncbi:hypothetical protein [Ornithobacterium rhinotracheale]|uniref:hypothetical protein n=1 Tax=Ornithobacterium rhinotracheale TaxID=28251 RepID=UPI004035DD81